MINKKTMIGWIRKIRQKKPLGEKASPVGSKTGTGGCARLADVDRRLRRLEALLEMPRKQTAEEGVTIARLLDEWLNGKENEEKSQ